MELIPADRGGKPVFKIHSGRNFRDRVNEGILYLLTEVSGLFYLISSVFATQTAILNNFFGIIFGRFETVEKRENPSG